MWSDVRLKNPCSNRGWSWQVLCSHKKCCCICSLCRGYYCYWGIFVFCIFSRVFSWFFTDVTTIRILVCVSIKYLINPSFERISLGWNSDIPGVICCFWHHVALEFLMFHVKLTEESLPCLLKLIFHKLHDFWEHQT